MEPACNNTVIPSRNTLVGAHQTNELDSHHSDDRNVCIQERKVENDPKRTLIVTLAAWIIDDFSCMDRDSEQFQKIFEEIKAGLYEGYPVDKFKSSSVKKGALSLMERMGCSRKNTRTKLKIEVAFMSLSLPCVEPFAVIQDAIRWIFDQGRKRASNATKCHFLNLAYTRTEHFLGNNKEAKLFFQNSNNSSNYWKLAETEFESQKKGEFSDLFVTFGDDDFFP